MTCLVCREQRETTGVACAECLQELALTIAITPEQLSMHGTHPTPAALVDPWGRLHRLQRKTLIGREHEEDGLRILDSTISRKHAVLELQKDGRHGHVDLIDRTLDGAVPVGAPAQVAAGAQRHCQWAIADRYARDVYGRLG